MAGQKATIILTAGHSNGQPGAASPDGRYREEVLALELRNRVAEILRSRGYTVLTDGAGAVNLPLREAIRLARNHVGPELEIHFNAGATTATGVEAFALPAQKVFAQAVAQNVARALGLKVRGDRGWKHPQDSQHSQLGICNAGAVLLEVCFISNPEDMRRYVASVGAVAEAVAQVLAHWATGQAMLPRPPAQTPPQARAEAAPPAATATAPAQPEFWEQVSNYDWATRLPQQSALLPRSGGRKSLWVVVLGHIYAALSAVVAWWKSVPVEKIWLGVLIFCGVLLVVYLWRQVRLDEVRERARPPQNERAPLT